MNGSTRVAVITGGGGGIGAATGAILAGQGWKVVLADLDLGRAEAEASRIGAVPLALDIADASMTHAAAQWVEQNVGPCFGLVACAAHLENPHEPQAQKIDEFDRIIETNIRGTFLTVSAFGSGMLARGAGSIVTISSITALNSSPLVAYGPSKAAIIAMTRNFAVAWGRKGIRANCVCPGPTRTPAVEASYARGERNPETMRVQTALGHLVAPQDVGNAIAFLLSDAARSITGITLPVDAGTLATHLWSLYGGVPQ